MSDGIISSLKKKFNEVGNERLIELYEVQSLYNDVTNQINSEGNKVSMVVEPEQIDSVKLAKDIRSNIDSINELDQGPTNNFDGETFYNLDDYNSVYNFDYSLDELQENEETPVEPTTPETTTPIPSNDFNFSDISDNGIPEEIKDVPIEEAKDNTSDKKKDKK